MTNEQFEALSATYETLLTDNALPGMSADDLWHEVIAVRDGLESHFIPAAWAEARTREQIQTVADTIMAFWRAWDEVEDAADTESGFGET